MRRIGTSNRRGQAAAGTGRENGPCRARAGGRLIFAGPRQPITVEGAAALKDELAVFLGDWPFREGEGGGGADIIVEQTGKGYVLRGPHTPDDSMDLPDARYAANWLAGALISAYVAQDEGLICLHAAANRVGSGLVVFMGGSLAGKSSLALQFAAAGHRFFCDDRLVMHCADKAGAPTGICLGLVPKVRLPLPAGAGDGFAEFINRRRILCWDDAAYLRLARGEAARFGDRCGVSALIVLSRHPQGPATLRPAARAEIVRALLSHIFAPNIPGARLVRDMTVLASQLPVYNLTFSNSREASRLVAARFAGAADA